MKTRPPHAAHISGEKYPYHVEGSVITLESDFTAASAPESSPGGVYAIVSKTTTSPSMG
ncbi:hypothetical protein ABFP37_18520 [Burkholderia sp. RS01]|uniref:hypothetical protein n=1 Tax=unclassified Burkholderia TaxID=2613784 RepID=UPI003218D258